MIRKYKEIWIPIFCFIVITILLLINQILPIDLWIYEKISILIKEPLTQILKIFTFFGEPKTIAILSFVWIIYLQRKNKKEIKPFLLLLIISIIFIILLKTIFGRERPDILRLIPIDGYSFPSGHSIISVAFYGYLATYLVERKIPKKIIFPLCFILIIGIGFSRIYLGVHYFSDVLAGYSLGALAMGITNLLRRKDTIL